MVVATGTLGELGITPGHSQLLTGIKAGPVKVILEGGEEKVFFLSGGFIEVQLDFDEPTGQKKHFFFAAL